MIVKVLVLLTIVYFHSSDAVRCRICNQALSLDDCIRSVECAKDEECFMDEVVTAQLSIIFNGGCRARDVCASAASSGISIGKRDSSTDYIACSRCCDTNATNGLECNAKMCGIKGSGQTSQCYSCDSSKDGGQGDVDEPTKCGTLGNCQTDEVCGAELFALSNNQTHRYTCLNRRVCTLLTQKALEDIDRCKDPAQVAAGSCGNKKRSGQPLCIACCGDSLCNSGTCFQVLGIKRDISSQLRFHCVNEGFRMSAYVTRALIQSLEERCPGLQNSTDQHHNYSNPDNSTSPRSLKSQQRAAGLAQIILLLIVLEPLSTSIEKINDLFG